MDHKLLQAKDWTAFPRREFAAWFNQLEGLRSPVMLGTKNTNQVENIGLFSSMTHVGARPPLLGLVFRPLTVERHSYENLKSSGFYTINHFSAKYLAQAHATSAKYERHESEFKALGFTPTYGQFSSAAPYIKEASVSFLCAFEEEHFIAKNDTVFVVGSVKEIRVPLLAEFGNETILWDEMDGLVVSGLYDYFTLGHHKKEAYAKPR